MTKVEFITKHFPRKSGNRPLKIALYALLYSASAQRARRMYVAAKAKA